MLQLYPKTDPNLTGEKLVDFPADERFIKLPIENYLSIMKNPKERDEKGKPRQGIDLIGPQIALTNAVNSPDYRFIVACLSRRTGKTFIANVLLQLVALVPNTQVLIMAPNYSLSSISWDIQKALLNEFGIERVRENAKDKIFELKNGSIIRIGSVGQVDSCVGRSYDLIIFDEAALDDRGGDAFNIALRPTLDKLDSKCIFISTPRGDNWFKEFFERGDDSDFPEWCSIQSDWKENPRVSEHDIKQARKAMSGAQFAQEYEADFAIFEGQIYSAFNNNLIEDLSEFDWKQPQIEIIGGLDLGYRDATAFVVVAIDTDSGKHYVLDGFYTTTLTTDKIAEPIQEMIDKYDIDYIYVDSANQQQKADLAMIYGIPSINANKSQVDGFGYLSGLMERGDLIVDQSLTYLIKSLKNLKWNPKTVKPKQEHNDFTHYPDALRYCIYTHSPSVIQGLDDIDEEDIEGPDVDYWLEELERRELDEREETY